MCGQVTHAYSGGKASKLHQHLWVNVATTAVQFVMGPISNHDYDEFSHSEDEYGFVLLKGQAGPDPEILVKRYSRGDDGVTKTINYRFHSSKNDRFPSQNQRLSVQQVTYRF
ncbi:MAG: hypothetical protein IPG18_04700 [Saprospiraceae bacterium]|nr:hypothetical protein [Saprospiraceae bacterium]